MQSDFKASVLSGFAWQSLTKLFVQIASWTSTVFVARLLAPADYGIMATVGIFTGLLTLLVEMGMSQGLIQKKDISREEEDSIFYLCLILGVTAYLILFYTAPLIARFYANEMLVDVLRLSATALVLGSLKAVPFGMAMRQMNFRYRALVEMLANLSSMTVVLIMAWHGYGVWSLIWGYLIMSAMSTVCYLWLFRRIPKMHLSLRKCRRILGFGAQITANNLLYFFYMKADVFIIGRMLGDRMLGYYSMAFQLATLPLDKIGAIFNQVAFPAVSRIQHDHAQAKTLFLNLHRYLLILTYPLLIGFALLAEDLIRLLLTDKWLPTVPILQVFCVLNLLRISGMLVSPVLYGRGKAGKVLIYTLFSSVALPTGFWVGAGYGINGILIGWLVVYPVLYSLLLFFCVQDLQIRIAELLSSAMPALVGSVVMVASVLAMQQALQPAAALLRLVLCVGMGALTYLSVFLLFYRDQMREVREGLALLRKGKLDPIIVKSQGA